MRTRFLNNDYFALPPSQRFLHLPIPRLHAPPHPSAIHDLLSFDSPIPVSNHIEPLPIAAALSAFLSAVLPQKIHLELRDLDDPAVVHSAIRDRSSSFSFGSVESRNPEQGAAASFEENGSESCRNFGSEADIESPKESKRIASSDKNGILCETIQFETPELDALLENVCFTEKERMQMLYETPVVENCQEMLKPEPPMQFPYEAMESISLVENVIPEYLKEEDVHSFEDNISGGQISHSGQNMFLTLEVDEESLGIPTCLSMVEIVGSYFDGVKPHDFDDYQSITDEKELLGTMSYNMMKFFSDECVSKQSLVLSDMFSDSDFTKLLETEHVGGNTAMQACSDLFMNLITFQEFVFLDEDFIQTIEAFYDTKALDILETSDCMFNKEFNFKNFDELVVSNEIALMDDTFKSLPVPVISDHKKLLTLHDIIGELFSNLKTRPLSASDGIYLNWDLLEKDECNYKISNWYQNLWAKIDLKYLDFGGKSFDDRNLVFDLVFSGDVIDECDIAQSEELQKLPSICMSLLDNQPIEFASAKILEHGSSKQVSGEQLPEKNSERASLFFKSMSEVNGLDYFMNPQKATVRENCNFAVESTNANLRVPEISTTKLKAGLQSQQLHTVLHNMKGELKCEGVEMPPNAEMLMGSATHPIFNPKENMTNQKLDKLLKFRPVEQSYDIKSSHIAPEADNFVPLMPAVRTDNGHQRMETFPGSVIIVNTQKLDKEMIFSRRSSYQEILAMEKGGVQVVERDLDFPVDIILSSSICLAWYDSKNLGKKATPVTEASSSLRSCIENIAIDVLTFLSFYFRGCFLVFEGEFNFLSTVMEFSDGLYAAAGGLGIDLQIFFSYSPELTSEVIVSCIKSATKLTRHLYPKMPESVTLAESFLTQFPGINPLTAHSILSSGTNLNEFLSWSHEQRMHVLEKYHVPEESISLFSIFCRYGEREDSKSIMTDCSSSVSSGPDSDKCYPHQAENERKRKTHISIHQKDELCFDDLLQFDTLNQVVKAVPDSSSMPKLSDLGMSKDTGRSSDLARASLSMGDFSGRKQRSSSTMMRDPPIVSQSSRDLWNFNASQIPEQFEHPHLSSKHKELAHQEDVLLDTAMMGKNLSWHNLSSSEKLQEDVRGEVVDFIDCPLLDKNFSVSDFMNFPNLMNETERDNIRKNKISRRLSFDNSCHPEANSSRICRSSKDTPVKVGDYAEPDFGKDALSFDFKHRENIFDQGLSQTSMRNQQRLPFQEEMSHLGRTPLSRARWSASPSKNSPWTTEFMNRFKEKSKSRQKSISCGKSAPCFGYSGNISNVSRRRSPSIIELFKYQSSETPANIPEPKRQKQSGQSSNSAKKGRYSASVSSCTPNDKISTKTLTFGRKGSGTQTKLVWSDANKLRYQSQ